MFTIQNNLKLFYLKKFGFIGHTRYSSQLKGNYNIHKIARFKFNRYFMALKSAIKIKLEILTNSDGLKSIDICQRIRQLRHKEDIVFSVKTYSL